MTEEEAAARAVNATDPPRLRTIPRTRLARLLGMTRRHPR